MQRYFLQNPFPVIFISENDSQFIKVSLEYRSLTPLTLGVDITKIATETDWQRLQVLKFLEQHGIHTVQVILFEDLEACKKTFKQPESPYQDVNGKPTSNWLLALKKPTQQMFFKQTKSNATTEDSAHMTQGELLLDSAKKYHEIDLGSKEAHLSTATSEHSIEAAVQAFARMRFRPQSHPLSHASVLLEDVISATSRNILSSSLEDLAINHSPKLTYPFHYNIY